MSVSRRDDADFARRKVSTLNIDSMQGMALLYWAAKETGQASFTDIANQHQQTCTDYLIREDYSSFHCSELDTGNGQF